MGDMVVENLLLDLLEWVANRPRSYEEVMDAWRTSCPQLPIWEEAHESKLIVYQELNGKSIVAVTPSGFAYLERRNRPKSTSDEFLTSDTARSC